MKIMFFSLAYIFFIIGLTACSNWPESARPYYGSTFVSSSVACKVRSGTLESRLQTEIYDAARKAHQRKY